MFKIGDEVVCVDDSGRNNRLKSPPIKRGNKYIVQGVRNCQGCGCNEIYVGIHFHSDTWRHWCLSCNHPLIESSSNWYMAAKRFRKVEKKINYIKQEIKVKKPILN